MIRFLRPLLAIVGVLAVLALIAAEADARPGRSGSVGSRGSRTYTAPPATTTAPTTARPIERSAIQPGQPSALNRPAAPAAQPGGFFSRPGLLGGLAAGLLGAGLIGMLFGQGLFSNLAGFASILGFILQIALVGGVAFLLYRWWQRRSQPQPAFAGGGSVPDQAPPQPMRMDLGGSTGGSFLKPAAAPPTEPTDEIGIKPEDYETFERTLGEIQTAYSNEDVKTLRARATPEMFSYLSEELADHASRGVVARLSGVKLLQGDLAEAWREGDVEYATVAMRYELVDQTIERASGRVVEGEVTPVEVTELWTFMRGRGGTWLLSAIQQT